MLQRTGAGHKRPQWYPPKGFGYTRGMNHPLRHQVIFSLGSGPAGPATEAFLRDGRTILSAIPGVTNFGVFRQFSSQSNHDFGFSMDFADQAAYDAYSNHPAHVAFVRDRWKTEVVRFLEIDFQEI